MGWWDKRSGDGPGGGRKIGDGDVNGNGNGNGSGSGDDRGKSDRNGRFPVPAAGNAAVPFVEPGKPSRRAFLERQIAEHIKANPDAVVRLIRRWLREDEE